MKTNRIIGIVAAAALIITLIYSFRGTRDDTAYRKKIEAEREEKDRFMRNSPESPFAASPDDYEGLNYFPPDIHYRVIATVEPVQNRKTLMLATSDGKQQRYREYAYAKFKLDGVDNRLLILEIADPGPSQGQLFLAFADETSAAETYGAGRYLDVTHTPGSNTVTLDFNLAYNPYCAYNEMWSCPITPAENRLKVPIRAGEKLFDE